MYFKLEIERPIARMPKEVASSVILRRTGTLSCTAETHERNDPLQFMLLESALDALR